jgi:hypothetical protein
MTEDCKPYRNETIEARRTALMTARNTAYAGRDWQTVNEITKRLAKLPVKGEKDYPAGS